MNTVKFIGMDVHKKRSQLPLLMRAVKTNPGFMAPLPTSCKRWTNSVVKWSPLQPDYILSMKPAHAVTAFTVT